MLRDVYQLHHWLDNEQRDCIVHRCGGSTRHRVRKQCGYFSRLYSLVPVDHCGNLSVFENIISDTELHIIRLGDNLIRLGRLKKNEANARVDIANYIIQLKGTKIREHYTIVGCA